MKTCTKCREVKTPQGFYRDRKRKDGLTPWCKECWRNYSCANREKKSDYDRSYYKKNRAKILAYQNEYAENQAEAVSTRRKLRRDANKPLANAEAAFRYAKMIKRAPAWISDRHKKQMLAVYEISCDCRLLTGESYHVDHIVPLRGASVCGLHVPWNLQVLPADVNFSKNAKFDGGWE